MKKRAASVVFAAGKGSRMIGFDGNKTLLPLVSRGSLYEGQHPMLLEVLSNLPPGPKGVVVHHRAQDIREATQELELEYLHQPAANGTGGALLAARHFLAIVPEETVIITMGDVPLIRPATYERLMAALSHHAFVLLAFEPKDRGQYGMVEMEGESVVGIVEWKYWSKYPGQKQEKLRYGNAGVYAARRRVLLRYLEKLAARPHVVRKQRGDRWVDVEEFFLTDLVELMNEDGMRAGMVVAPEFEVTGVDTPESLARVQDLYARLAMGQSPWQESGADMRTR
ncbi:MAG: NTP transferase domain-containing protein [Deltaproteobacteria bacterium]|nr:NTP transferase domain-containing protein [Deltaproteobacteria bacterium]